MMRYSERSKNKWKKEEVWTDGRQFRFPLAWSPSRCGDLQTRKT